MSCITELLYRDVNMFRRNRLSAREKRSSVSSRHIEYFLSVFFMKGSEDTVSPLECFYLRTFLQTNNPTGINGRENSS